ncbi:C2H2 finger domain-containing protein [Diplocarpon rosae]|nr:C2H2 finger domain-containing protein [Diplocarpon rosae]
MPPTLAEQNAAGQYQSSFDFGTESGSSSARMYSGYSSSAQGGSASTSLENMRGIAHPHLEPSRQCRSLRPSSSGGASASKILSHRPNSSAPQSQSTLSIYGYGPQPPPQKQGSSSSRVEVRPNSFMSHSHGRTLNDNNSLRPLHRSQGRDVITPSRLGYPPKKQTLSQYQRENSLNEDGGSRGNIPSTSKAPLKASANMAHPSHYQQSNVQYSSSPDRAPHATPKSSMQVVITSRSPVHYYSNSPTPAYSGRGRAAKSAFPMDSRPSSEPPPKKRGRPFSNKTLIKKLPKKRGRPFTSVAAEVEAAARKAAKAERAAARATRASESENRGRRPRIRHQFEIAQPKPIFYPFICEWKNCSRELQNLETLRLHIHVAHKKRVDGKAQCLWAQCGRKEKTPTAKTGDSEALDEDTSAMEIEDKNVIDKKSQVKRPAMAIPSFTRRQEWKDHLEEKHLIPFAWHMGEGHKATDLSGKRKGMIEPRWLNDQDGKEVTASVEGQLLEEGRAAKNNARRFRKQRGANSWAVKELKAPKQLQGLAMAPPILASSDDDDDSGTGADGGEDGLGVEDSNDEEDGLGKDGFFVDAVKA